jgi:hypothetical protein
MRFLVPGIAPVVIALALVGCTQPIPDSGAGVGDGSYSSYLQGQAARAGQPTPLAPYARNISQEAVTSVRSAPLTAGQSARNAYVQPATAPQGQALRAGAPLSGVASTSPGSSGVTMTGTQRAGVSDEQDFGAVSARETIASDRERLAQQRAQYQFIEVESVPDGTASGPNIVAYALSARNAVGESIHRRSNLLRGARWQSACAQYRTQDLAQEAFLSAGGPSRDSGNLDPDGDGFACWWDPTPYRHAATTAAAGR